MKRFGAVLLVLALVLCVCLLGPRLLKKVGADLGSFSGSSDYGGDSSSSGWDNGSSWGSGSSWDSGSGWDGGSSWDSGGNGFFFFPVGSSSSSDSGDSSGFGNLLFYVVLIIILIMIFSRKNQHQATPHAGTAAGAQQTPGSKLQPMSEYAQLDPNFSESDLRERLSNIYVQMQNGCTARNIEAIRPYANVTVVKMGTRGSMLVTREGRHHLPAMLNKSVVDAIGAGDSFDAGFIAAYVSGKPLDVCQRVGNLTGAVNTTAAGGTGAFTSKAAVEEAAMKHFGQKLEL